MALTQLQASYWSSKLLLALQKNLVFGQDSISNKFYQQEASAGAKEVHIHNIADVTVVNYSKYMPLNPEQLTDTRQTLLLDQQKAFSFFADDIDVKQANPAFVESIMDQAGYQLVETADSYIANLFSAAGVQNLGTVETSNSGNIYARILKAKTLLDNNNIPKQGRFLILSPEFEELPLLNTQVQTIITESMLNGAVGKLAGFDIVSSVDVVKSGVSPTQRHRILAGHPMAWTFASQIQEMQVVREPRMFVDTCSGLFTYGAKVIRGAALVDLAVQI